MPIFYLFIVLLFVQMTRLENVLIVLPVQAVPLGTTTTAPAQKQQHAHCVPRAAGVQEGQHQLRPGTAVGPSSRQSAQVQCHPHPASRSQEQHT